MEKQLQRSLTPTLLWGLGVGYVISGLYFGWNLGLQKGGTLGMAVATGLAVLMYVCFTLCYAELACAIPKAGGIFDYATRALGKDAGLVAGVAQVFEFVLAPPAIAAAIGAHINLFFPLVSINQAAIGAYILFTLLNVRGVKLAATFELGIATLAVLGLLLFAGLTMPSVSDKNLTTNVLPNGLTGIWAAIPFAIWFFLGIEGLANAAEESHHPQRDLTRGFASAMLTLVLLCGLTFVGAVGVAGWEAAVLKPDGTASDSPLPLVLSRLVGADSGWYYAIIVFGVFGLVASFHGLLMAAGRATFELGRGGYFSAWLGRVHSRFQTPTNALIINMLLGIGALLTNTTADIIVLSVLGALTLYIFGALSVWQLRRREPHLPRPFRTPVYGLVVSCTFVLAAGALLVVSYLNGQLAIYYLVGLLAAFLFVKINQYFFQN